MTTTQTTNTLRGGCFVSDVIGHGTDFDALEHAHAIGGARSPCRASQFTSNRWFLGIRLCIAIKFYFNATQNVL